MLVAAIVLVLLTVATFPTVSANGANGIVVRSSSDAGIDPDDDGILDRLAITLEVHVMTAGTYTVYGIIKTIDTDPIVASNATDLAEGNGPLVIEFEGRKLYETGMKAYTVDLRITGGERGVSHTHVTGAYDFDPEPMGVSPAITMGNDNITLEFPSVMHVPTIKFHPTLMKQKYNFQVSFDTLIGFADDGDGVFTEADGIVLRGDLKQSLWEGSIYQAGGVLRMTFENIIDLWDVDESNPVGTVTIKFIFNTAIEGTYKKFDIDLDFSGSFEGVDHFALRHTLEDLTDTTRFNVGEVGGEPRIQFLNGGNEEMAYYEWVDEAQSYEGDSVKNVDLTYTTEVKGDVMTLQVCYPYEAGADRILHDPILGIKEWVTPGDPDIEEKDNHSFISFLGALIVGGLFIGYTIHSRRKRE